MRNNLRKHQELRADRYRRQCFHTSRVEEELGVNRPTPEEIREKLLLKNGTLSDPLIVTPGIIKSGRRK